MVRISMLYPTTPGGRFDMAYYLDIHMPQSIERLSVAKGFRSVSVERGIGGGAPGAPPYVAVCHYVFDTAEDFIAAFMPHAAFLQGDISHLPGRGINLIERARRKRIDLHRVDVAIAGRLHASGGVGFFDTFARIGRLRLRARSVQRFELARKRQQLW